MSHCSCALRGSSFKTSHSNQLSDADYWCHWPSIHTYIIIIIIIIIIISKLYRLKLYYNTNSHLIHQLVIIQSLS